MSAVFTILNKVFVREFYRANATFFLLVIGLAGGFMRSQDHIALAEFQVSSPFLLLIAISIWCLYIFKITDFHRKVLKRGENEFIFYTAILPVRQQFTTLLGVLALELIPVFAYALFLILTAAKHALYQSAALVVLACVVLLVASTLHLFWSLRHPHRERKTPALERYIHRRFTKPYPLFFPEWILRRAPFLLIGTKIFSALVLYGVAQLYRYDTYDARLMGMAVVLAFSANVNLVWEMHRFDNVHFGINRNLPIPLGTRLRYFLITLFLLTLPEAGLLVNHFSSTVAWQHLVLALLYGWSICLFFYSWLFKNVKEQDQLMSVVFFTCMGLVVLVLFGMPVWLLIVVATGASLYGWRKYYYAYERLNSNGS
ncbi:hypothetical protein [Chryseolinea lacunae]|uniref:ABC transporter permease n=1 Tax=Chryseolinea lacunae TaxID=2801331 RepID=A0ABS1KPB7_9BACT|nr:hypothetical protein [Chryseolinea lacunae]MBL0740121.1 hypothetical protein [Chryseolinea lacunae]